MFVSVVTVSRRSASDTDSATARSWRSRSEMTTGFNSGTLGRMLNSLTNQSVTWPGLKIVTEDSMKMAMTHRMSVPSLRSISNS